MLATIIPILLTLPSAILAVIKIVTFRNKKDLHTINNQAILRNSTQLTNSNDNQIIIGDNNIQKKQFRQCINFY